MPEPIRISTKPTPAQVDAVIAAGPGATVCHPWVAWPGRRRQLEQALGRAGVPHRIVRTLGWTAKGPAAPAPQVVADDPEPEPEDTIVDGEVEPKPRRKKKR